METRNIVLQFTNNSQVAIDWFVFTEYFNLFEIDCELGLINKM